MADRSDTRQWHWESRAVFVQKFAESAVRGTGCNWDAESLGRHAARAWQELDDQLLMQESREDS